MKVIKEFEFPFAEGLDSVQVKNYYCSECGVKLKRYHKYCWKCGHKLDRTHIGSAKENKPYNASWVR